MLTHHQVITNINDAVAEATEVYLCTTWEEEIDFSWIIRDISNNFIGRVNAKVDYGTGLVTLRYNPNRNTFSGLIRVPKVVINAAMATDMQEQMKISEMDHAIGMSHNLIEEDCDTFGDGVTGPMGDHGHMGH